MSAVDHFFQLTVELVQLLENTEGGRDGKIVRIEELMNQREALVKEIVPPYTSEEVELGKKLIHLNDRLAQLMQLEKTSIQKDIKKLQLKKESNNKYVNPYQNLSTDGMFYDKRK